MDELKHGDAVLTLDAHGAQAFKQVFLFGHRDADATAPFHCIKAAGKEMCLTADHFLLASDTGRWADARTIRGGKARVGQTVWETSGSAPAVVEEVTVRWLKGLFNPYTVDNHYIVVDGLVASTHSSWFLDDITPAGLDHLLPAVYQTVLEPAQWLYKLMGAEWAAGLQHRLQIGDVSREEGALAGYKLVLTNELPAILSKLMGNVRLHSEF